jgi:hypothetical protein
MKEDALMCVDTREFKIGYRVEVLDSEYPTYFGITGTITAIKPVPNSGRLSGRVHPLAAILIEFRPDPPYQDRVATSKFFRTELYSWRLKILPMSIAEQTKLRLIYG